MSEQSAAPKSVRLGEWYEAHARRIVGLGALIAFLLMWESVARLRVVDPMFISSPTRVAVVAGEMWNDPDFWRDLKVSGTEFLWGYLAAIALGVPLGLAMGWYRRVQYVFGPFVDILNAAPRVTFMPILVLWFGIGLWSKFAVVFLGALIPIILSTYSGVRTNEARFLRVARSFGASQFKTFTSIILPGTAPFIFTGLKYASGRALLGVVVGELYAATAGIGHMIAQAGNAFETDIVIFGVLIFTVSGLVVTGALDRIERRFDRWRPEGAVR